MAHVFWILDFTRFLFHSKIDLQASQLNCTTYFLAKRNEQRVKSIAHSLLQRPSRHAFVL